MAQLLENTQMQNNTTASEGSGYKSLLTAESCFVLHTNNSIEVTELNSFGADNNNHFKTTTKFTFDGTLNVYSLCAAQVLVQPHIGNNELVNLILKPVNQPVSDIPIKYVIYRGINKNTIINEDDEISGNENSGSAFVKSIWKQFNQFFTNDAGVITAPPFLAKFIGYSNDPSLQPTTKRLDEMFFKLSDTVIVDDAPEEPADTAYELPIASMGMHLGDATTSLGVDIILDDGAYQIANDPTPFTFDLAFARDASNTLIINSSVTAYEQKLLKETSTKFIDYVAFVGLHTNGLGKLHLGGQTLPLTEALSIYNVLNNCHTKDTKYLYIQSNRQRYYNFYDNYVYSTTDSNNIKIGDTETTLTNKIFDEHWPVITLENINTIKLQLLTDNHLEASLYVAIGSLNTPHRNHFVKGEHLKQAAASEPEVVVDEKYTTIIELQAPNTYAGIWQLIYKGQKLYAPEASDPDKVYEIKDIDDLFGLLDAEPLLKPNKPNEYASVVENKLQLSHNFIDANTTNVSVIRLIKIADAIAINEEEMLERMTFETLLSDSTSTANTLASKDNVIDSILTFDLKQNNFYEPRSPYDFVLNKFTFENRTIQSIVFPSAKGNLKKLLGISKDEFLILKNYIENEQINEPKLLFNPTTASDLIYNSPENISYNVYLLAISGFKNNESLKIYPFENIKVFTLDNNCYFSDSYSKYLIKREVVKTTNFLIREEL